MMCATANLPLAKSPAVTGSALARFDVCCAHQLHQKIGSANCYTIVYLPEGSLQMRVVHMASALTMSILAWKHRCSYAHLQSRLMHHRA
jgi:hypothetical protein